MSERGSKPRRGGGKPFGKGRPGGPRPGREGTSDGPVILYGWHTVTMALQNRQRRIRRLFVTENAARRLTEENIETRVTPEMVRPSQIDARLGPDAVHQGLLAEADPLPSPDIETLALEGMVLVLDQITDPHNVGAILRSAAGVRAKAASGALELVPIVTVQNLARALTRLNERGFMTVGLDSAGSENLSSLEFE